MDFVDDELTHRVIGCAIRVHRGLGPGLLESAYQVCLAHELMKAAIPFQKEVPLPVMYDGLQLDCAYRMDFVVESALIIEIKAIDKVLPIHEAQLMTYMRLSGLPRGLILNFNVTLLKSGILRRAMTKRVEDPIENESVR